MTYQTVTIGIAIIGILGTWLVGSFMLGRAVEQIKASLSEKIAGETKQIETKIDTRLNALVLRFDDEQKTQDHVFGEVGLSLRQRITDVEKEMHTIEIWGRDNYVLKSEFVKVADMLRDDIKAVGADMKADIRALSAKITAT